MTAGLAGEGSIRSQAKGPSVVASSPNAFKVSMRAVWLSFGMYWKKTEWKTTVATPAFGAACERVQATASLRSTTMCWAKASATAESNLARRSSWSAQM